MKKILYALALLTSTVPALAGESAAYWQPLATVSGVPRIRAEKYITYQLQTTLLTQKLVAAPQNPEKGILVELPQPDGQFKTFRIWETPISFGAFYEKYPGLRTYTGVQTDDLYHTVKLDVGEGRFHAMIFSGNSQYFIDPFSLDANAPYMVYDRKDMSLEGREKMRCELEAQLQPDPEPTQPDALFTNGTIKRTYRLALACTGEYAQAATGTATPTKVQVLAAMITSINRVNGIYERELAATMMLVPNTDTLIFFDGSTDPYDNNNGSAMLGQNQTTVTNRIGSLNYDIGHVFSTGGGGIASLGSLCSNVKAQGVTGSANPVGDPFDVDYVAHEMGHQFGGQHTFNANTGSCSGNGSTSSAYEPGSGSTIMAYAGICGAADNIQQNSDAYFHARSLDQATTRMSNVPTCGTAVATGTLAPVVTQAAASYSIPWVTPFELMAPSVSGTAVTYCWEQHDLGNFRSSYNINLPLGPIWRSYWPDPSPTRVFPSLGRLLRNIPGFIGDRLPTIARTMNFRLTTRDVANGTGAFTISNTGIVSVTTVVAPDTFRITNLMSNLDTLFQGTLQEVTWTVSNTTAAPINCPSVDIYFSTDSGRTWPYLLAAGVPNDGLDSVIVPTVTTTRGRIKIKASNNVFFVINRALLTVAAGTVPSAVKTVSGAAAQVHLYPVPAKASVQIDLPQLLTAVQASLYNSMGQQVWKGTLNAPSTTFPVRMYPAGTYYFHLQNPEKNFAETVPFVVQ
ncbi:MAG: hypothetical protein EOP52_08550 [Sphingobacteriales bacterium]|nr:MAG: hypothetical protein EOP52_08550 [Sphingobacteriales bacterium]